MSNSWLSGKTCIVTGASGGMGAGIAASRTPTPWKNRLRSLLTHAVFGAGLYFCGLLLNWCWK